MKLLLLAFAAILWSPARVQGMYGYDCGDQITNVTTISLVDIGDCDIEQSKVTVTEEKGQLLQLNDFGSTHVTKCRIKIHREITHCGTFSHASRVRNGELSYFHELTRDECIKIHQTQFYTIAGAGIHNLPRNQTKPITVVFAGSADVEGTCKGGTYSDPYGTWDDVYVAGWVEILLADYYAEVSLNNDKIILHSGHSCKMTDTTCNDFDGGQVFWDPLPTDNCGMNKYSVLHDGTINKTYDAKEDQVLYSLETQELTFALLKKGEDRVCGYKIIRTEHPKLFIVEDLARNKFMEKKEVKAANLDIFTYVNSKFVYIEKWMRREIVRMYFDILKNKCELERKVLANALAIATLSPSEFGLKLMEEEGYLGVVTGEVVHLLKCQKVDVTTRRTEECYEQLPVFWKKEEYFLAPRTRILVKSGTQVLCDQRLPSMFKLAPNSWWKMLPNALTKTDEPEILKPKKKPTWTYNSPHTLAMGGIYSDKDTRRLRDLILFPLEQPAVLNTVAMGISGRPINNQGISLAQFFDRQTLDKIVESTYAQIWDKFMTFGTASAGIIGMFMLFRLIKLVLDTIIHGYAIYSLYGFSIHLIGAVWNSVTQLLLHLAHQAKEDINTPEEQIAINDNLINKSTDVEKGEEKKEQLYPKLPDDYDRCTI